MAVTNRYIWSKLSTGRPRGIVVKVKVYMCRGPGPIPKGAEIARTIRQQTQELRASRVDAARNPLASYKG